MQITLGELVTKIRIAQQVMSRKNLHRVLLGQCEAVILSLVAELDDARAKPASEPPRIILP